jgi:hypothetical protein
MEIADENPDVMVGTSQRTSEVCGELHHLVHSPRIKPEPPGRRPLAQTLNLNRITNPSI